MPGTTAYPAALDTFPEIGPNTPENGAGVEHDIVHANEMAAIAALQAKVGVDDSGATTSIDFRIGAAENALEGLDTRVDALEAGGGGGAVDSVNGQTGAVVLNAADVGAASSAEAAALAADIDSLDGRVTALEGGSGGASVARQIGAGFESMSGDITAPASLRFRVNHSGTIDGYYIDAKAGETGSAVFDVKRNGASIVAAAPPSITGADAAASTMLTGWTTSYSAGDFFEFILTAASGFTQLALSLRATEA